jgi:hypothetical protein
MIRGESIYTARQQNMNWNQIILLISLLFFLQHKLICQEQRFNAGLIAGLNFAELEGNEITDYYGINAGIFGTAKLSRHSQIGIEFLFSQNGEYILPEYYPQLQYGKVWLNHLEIPVHIDWLIRISKKEQFHNFNFNLGIAYTRILGYYAEDINKVDVTEQVIYEDKDAFLLQTGMIINFTKNLGLNLKASLPIRVEMLDWTLAARIIYTIG